MAVSPQDPRHQAGWHVAGAAIDALRNRFGARLASGYAIGSLAHGGFAPAVSDIDVAVMLDACSDEVPAAVADAVAATRRRLDSPLADRLSVFYGDWQTFAQPAASARLHAIDRLDLMQHGVLLSGVDKRQTHGTVPGHRQLIDATLAYLAQQPLRAPDPVELVAAGPRPLTRAALLPARFLYTHQTGRAGGAPEAGRWYCDAGRPSAPLVDAALRWRSGRVPAGRAVALVQAHLAELQAECMRAFAP